MDDTATTTPTPDTASATSASAAAGYDAASSEKAINAGDNNSSSVGVGVNVTSGVKLLIKSSNQQYDDINIESDLCWTVKRLKTQLSLVYPGKPNINEQKLIYSGKLLDDAQKLSEVIRSYKDVYQQHHIFHLVCASKQPMKPVMKAPASNDTAATRNEAHHNANELRQRNLAARVPYLQSPPQAQPQQQQQLPPRADTQPWLQQAATAAATATTNANAQLVMQQQMLQYNAWVQQVYAYYMQQWMQRSTAAGATGDAAGAGQPAALPLPAWPMPHAFMQNLPVIPNSLIATAEPQPLAVPANEPQPQLAPQPAARPAEAAFPNVQEEPEMRDWLDSFFTFTRLAIFITVLYFNSSPMRCLFVLLIAGIIYLYHIGVLRRRRERNNNNINRNNNAENEAAFAVVQEIQRMMDVGGQPENINNAEQAAPQPAAHAAAEAAAAGDAVPTPAANENAAAVAAEAAAVEPPNANNSVIAVVRTFVITFFTSLLPEAPAL